MAKKPKEAPHLRVRIPPALLDRLERSRVKSRNTLTGEIVERIEESFRRDDTAGRLEATMKETAGLLLSVIAGRPIDDAIKAHIVNILRPQGAEGGKP